MVSQSQQATLHTAFSPCPNDTFMFHAMLHKHIDTRNLSFAPHLHDIDQLNQKGFAGTYDITKLSFFAALKLRDTYTRIDAGSALGFGCGPLLVGMIPDRFSPDALVAIPGELTTANLLLKLWNPGITRTVVDRFDNILQGVAAGAYDAGLIIHEGRFVYPAYGCKKIVDLGQWWEKTTGLPIPLGCIAVKNTSPVFDKKDVITQILKNSIQYAFDHPGASTKFVRSHAQEMADNVIAGHIDLYVNEFSLSLKGTGEKAVIKLEEMAEWANLL